MHIIEIFADIRPTRTLAVASPEQWEDLGMDVGPAQGGRAMSGRAILVVGGAGGVGRDVAAALAGQGAAVVVAGRSAAKAERVLDEIRVAVPGADLDFTPLDLAQYDDCRAVAEGILAGRGRLDAVVNCANVQTGGMGGRFEGMDPANFTAFLQASLTTVFNLCHAVLPSLAARSGGSIVNFASDSGRVAAPNQTMIGATRAAIMMFTRSLSLETAAQGVRVNCISSSFIRDTPVYDAVMAGPAASRARTAAARAGLGLPGPGDIAELAAFLCSDASRHLTGQVISVNGGVSAG
jgi:NAD(P)-dependent dehydrogenase (short-subunit alcohol dehydrogenase family)